MVCVCDCIMNVLSGENRFVICANLDVMATWIFEEDTRIAVWRVHGNDCEYSVGINVAHACCFTFPVRDGVLNDAQTVHP